MDMAADWLQGFIGGGTRKNGLEQINRGRIEESIGEWLATSTTGGARN
jgi:hypothetical protein